MDSKVEKALTDAEMKDEVLFIEEILFDAKLTYSNLIDKFNSSSELNIDHLIHINECRYQLLDLLNTFNMLRPNKGSAKLRYLISSCEILAEELFLIYERKQRLLLKKELELPTADSNNIALTQICDESKVIEDTLRADPTGTIAVSDKPVQFNVNKDQLRFLNQLDKEDFQKLFFLIFKGSSIPDAFAKIDKEIRTDSSVPSTIQDKVVSASVEPKVTNEEAYALAKLMAELKWIDPSDIENKTKEIEGYWARFQLVASQRSANLAKAKDLVLKMVKLGFIHNDPIIINEYVNEVMSWSADAFSSMNRYVEASAASNKAEGTMPPPTLNSNIQTDPTTLFTDEFLNKSSLDYINGLKKKETMPKTIKMGWITSPDGTRKHYNSQGERHFEGGPAEIRANGTQVYYKNGMLHREGGPAFIGADGVTKYAINDKYHREGDLPAIVSVEKHYRQQYAKDGFFYKAVDKYGNTYHFAPGAEDIESAILHREDGPAVEYADGQLNEYHLNGIRFPDTESYEAALGTLLTDKAYLKEQSSRFKDQVQKATSPTKNSKATKPLINTYQEKVKPMSKKSSLTEMMKKSATDAGYRVGATQANKLVKQALLAALRKGGSNEGMLSNASMFLETEIGEAILSILVGTGLNYVPGKLGEDPRLLRLAEEMRTNGMATGANLLIGEAMSTILPALTDVIQKLPAVEDAAAERVEEKARQLADEIEEEEEEETDTVVTAAKAARV